MKKFNKLPTDTVDSFSTLLEFAANNDIESFKRSVELDLSIVDYPGLWYVRKIGMKQITQEERTPLMVAATYGSLDVLKLIVALPEVDLNRSCGRDKWSALHCAAFGGSINASVAVKLLLSAGADPSIVDASGLYPIDVIVVHPKLPGGKSAIEDLLMNNISDGSVGECNLQVSISSSNVSSPVLSSSPGSRSPFSSTYSPKLTDNPTVEKKQYPVDPSLPDIRNSIYTTDEFRMFSFKIRPCSRAYSHDWTECPFVHPGENARRRDPRKFHYNCVPCPDFRKGACRRGDMCEYAHGVFECWLHPAQYRTRLCKDGTSCGRQVCFFAHTHEEIRPLYVSTGSGLPSPRSVDMASALNNFPFSPNSPQSLMSPTSNGMSAFPQPNVPTLHLPGSNNIQSQSRLRSSLSARDIPLEDYHDMSCFSPMNHQAKTTTLTPSNLENLFSSEMGSSPRFSPLHQFQQQQPSILSPINTNNTKVFSPRNVEHPLLQQGPFSSSPRMSPVSPMSPRLSAIQQMQMRSHNMPHQIIGSPNNNKWGSPNGRADWSVGNLSRPSPFQLRNEGEEPDLSWVHSLVKESPPETTAVSSGSECLNSANANVNSNSNLQTDSSVDSSLLGAWLEQMRLDQLVK